MKDSQVASGRKILIFLTKTILTTIFLYIVFIQADLEQIRKYVKQVDSWDLLLSLIILNIGQIISGLRMRYYFISAGLILSRNFSIALYYVGMLFNLILPGGIGGDGYKAYYLKKTHNFPWSTSLRLVISGRASGLLLLVILTLILALFSPYITTIPYAVPLIILGLIGVFPSYSILAKILLKETIPTQLGAAKYSFFVQASVLLTAILLLSGVGYSGDMTDYLVLFMLSSIVSIIPISIGGVGLRELTFFYGASLLHLDPELGVTISVLYFIVNTIASLLGVVFFYKMGKKRN